MTASAGDGDDRLRGAGFVGFIPVGDLGSARDFYVGVLGLSLRHEDTFAVAVDAGGTPVRLTQVADLRPQPFTVAGWEVPDVHAAVATLMEAGVTFRRFEGLDQDSDAVWTAPGGDMVAWFTDPDGNTLSLTGRARP